MQGTLIVTTFGENAGARDNQIYTSSGGPMVQPNSIVPDPFNFYSVMNLVEENWDLGNLGKEDARVKPIPNVWKKQPND